MAHRKPVGQNLHLFFDFPELPCATIIPANIRGIFEVDLFTVESVSVSALPHGHRSRVNCGASPTFLEISPPFYLMISRKAAVAVITFFAHTYLLGFHQEDYVQAIGLVDKLVTLLGGAFPYLSKEKELVFIVKSIH